jgi:hypothetical protein
MTTVRPRSLVEDHGPLSLWFSRVSGAMPALEREIVARVRSEVPEYRVDPGGAVSIEARRAVHEWAQAFLRMLEFGGELTPGGVEVFRRLGRLEAAAGRRHDTLQAAYRVASDTVVQRLLVWEREFGIPRPLVAEVSSAMSDSVARLADESARGYEQAQLARSGQQRGANQLISLLLRPGGASRTTIESWARRLRWTIPNDCAVVVAISAALGLPEFADLGDGVFDGETLAGFFSGQHVLVLSHPVLPPVVRGRLAEHRASFRLFLGSRVPLEQARISARLARRAAALTDARDRAEDGLFVCDEHLFELHAEAAADELAAMARSRLAPLAALSPAKRLQLATLLSAWLEYGGTKGHAPGVLDSSKQTLTYRLRRLDELFGAQLHDRDARLELMLALRVALPAWERDQQP